MSALNLLWVVRNIDPFCGVLTIRILVVISILRPPPFWRTPTLLHMFLDRIPKRWTFAGGSSADKIVKVFGIYIHTQTCMYVYIHTCTYIYIYTCSQAGFNLTLNPTPLAPFSRRILDSRHGSFRVWGLDPALASRFCHRLKRSRQCSPKTSTKSQGGTGVALKLV